MKKLIILSSLVMLCSTACINITAQPTHCTDSVLFLNILKSRQTYRNIIVDQQRIISLQDSLIIAKSAFYTREIQVKDSTALEIRTQAVNQIADLTNNNAKLRRKNKWIMYGSGIGIVLTLILK